MKDILKELQRLNSSVRRLADRFAPAVDTGVFDRFHAFRASSENSMLTIRGISHPDAITFSELRGIDDVLAGLRMNTLQFLKGLPCNNVLLYGPRGTGKSSATKALLGAYRRRGLRMIEVQRDSLIHIMEVAELIRGRQERFIVFCDDLSFEEDEKSYRRIKTVLEGGLEVRPENMLIYATSNRRHLMPEKTGDNLPEMVDGELQPAETVEEKLSLSDRFGLRLGMQHFDMETFLDIISNYAALRKIRIASGELRKHAVRWALDHGSFSGRTARQFIDDLEGRLRLKKSSPGRRSTES